jgi:hypothetical protein
MGKLQIRINIFLNFKHEILIGEECDIVMCSNPFRSFRSTKNFLSFLFLLLISVFIVPKEFIHSLYGHEDTTCFSHQGRTIEAKHQHCEILKYHAPVFVENVKIENLCQLCNLSGISIPKYFCTFFPVFNSYLLRAPPFSFSFVAC